MSATIRHWVRARELHVLALLLRRVQRAAVRAGLRCEELERERDR